MLNICIFGDKSKIKPCSHLMLPLSDRAQEAM